MTLSPLSVARRMRSLTDLARMAPSDWPALAQCGLGLVVCLITCVATWSLVVQAQMESLAAHERQEASLKATYRQRAAQAAALQSWRDQHVAMTARMSALRDRLPTDSGAERLLETLHRLGQAHRMQFEAIRPSKPETKEHLSVVPFEIQAGGRYHDVAGFLAALAALPRVVVFDALQITASPRHESASHLPPELRLTLSAQAYADPASPPNPIAEAPR